MNLVLITSVLQPTNDITLFTAKERYEQTLDTIRTVNEKIPNVYIVIIEGGALVEGLTFTNTVDYVFFKDVSHLTKSPGEAQLLYSYLTSSHYNALKDVLTLSKISGRYHLTNDFYWDKLPNDKTIIKYIHKAWLGKPLYTTRYYRMPKVRVGYFILGLNRYMNSPEWKISWPDIEHCFHLHNIVAVDDVYSPNIIGVCGLITGNGQYIMD